MTRLPSIAEAVAQMRDGRCSPIDLVERCLAQIDAFDDQVRAWVCVDAEHGQREAQRLAALASRGEIVGPLHGIPIGVKDIIDVAGMPTRCGSPLRQSPAPAAKDAPVVAQLRRAGAIVLGKTVTTEWACFDPPTTRNPWNLAHTPGGSSSGSAAAVAMEMCMGAIGTQTGGSIVRPASYCGVCGLKPTYFPDAMQGIAPVSFHLDHVGPIARTARDVAAMYRAMFGFDEREDATGLDIAVVEGFFQEHSTESVRKVFHQAWQHVAAELPKQNAPIELPASFAHVHADHWRIMAVESSEVHRAEFGRNPMNFGEKVRGLIQEGMATYLHDYVAALRRQRTFHNDLMHTARAAWLWAMPATPNTAPGLETTGDARFNSPWSYVGWPEMTIPCGSADDGLPVGLQIVAPPHSEFSVLNAAIWLEERLAFRETPKLLAEQTR